MGVTIGIVAFFGGFAAILAALAWLAVRARRRGIGDGVLGVFDEIWHPAAVRYRAEVRVQAERALPVAPAEDDR